MRVTTATLVRRVTQKRRFLGQAKHMGATGWAERIAQELGQGAATDASLR